MLRTLIGLFLLTHAGCTGSAPPDDAAPIGNGGGAGAGEGGTVSTGAGGAGGGTGETASATDPYPHWSAVETVLTAESLKPAFNNARLVERSPDGTVHAVIGTSGDPIYAWRAPGAAWQTRSLPAGPGNAARPALAWADGHLHVAWSSGGDVVVTRSTGGDASWDAPVAVAGGQPDGVSLHASDSAVVVAWSDRSTGRVSYARWTGAFSTPQSLDSAGGLSEDVALFGDGAVVWAAWDNRPAENKPRKIYLARSTDGGAQFSANQPLPLAQPDRPMSLGNDVGGCATGDTMWLGYQDFDGAGGTVIRLARSGDGGTSFEAMEAAGPGLFAHLDCDSAGAVAVLWEHFEGANAKNDAVKTVGLGLSLDGGSQFDGPHAMPGSASATGRMFPAMAIGGDAIDVMFVDKAASSWMYATAALR